jgi:putative YphP/YqiW family bacilliredoxin
MPYPELLVRPMREQLTLSGVNELKTAEEVDAFFDAPGTAMLVFNSVCGCAAGSARPGVIASLQDDNRPQRAGTVFAGQDVEATDRARQRLGDLPPSSPCVVLLREGRVTHHFGRDRIEGHTAEMVCDMLRTAFAELAESSATT